MILQAGEDVGEPGQWIDVVELGGLDQGIDCSGPPATIVGSGEGPVATSDGDAAKGALCSVVAEAQAAIVEEAAKSLPAVEAVGDGLGDLTGRRQCACRKLYPAYVERPRWQVLFQTTYLRERCSHMFGLFCAV